MHNVESDDYRFAQIHNETISTYSLRSPDSMAPRGRVNFGSNVKLAASLQRSTASRTERI